MTTEHYQLLCTRYNNVYEAQQRYKKSGNQIMFWKATSLALSILKEKTKILN